MQTITLEQKLIESLKLEFDTSNVKEAIMKLYEAYMQSKSNGLDIEVIDEKHSDYHLILEGREHRKNHPEDYGTMNDIDWA